MPEVADSFCWVAELKLLNLPVHCRTSLLEVASIAGSVEMMLLLVQRLQGSGGIVGAGSVTLRVHQIPKVLQTEHTWRQWSLVRAPRWAAGRSRGVIVIARLSRCSLARRVRELGDDAITYHASGPKRIDQGYRLANVCFRETIQR